MPQQPVPQQPVPQQPVPQQPGPQALFAWLADQPRGREVCVECGAGEGEVAAYMGRHFSRAIATDIAPLGQGSPHGVQVVQAPAERIPCGPGSVDLVVSMQALHHFDRAAHLAEAARVLRPGGVFAALAWGEMVLPAPVAALYRPAFSALAPHWEAGRPWVVAGYPGLAFAGERLVLPRAGMRRAMTLRELNAEIARWSASRRAARAGKAVPLPEPGGSAAAALGVFAAFWPIRGQVFRVRDGA